MAVPPKENPPDQSEAVVGPSSRPPPYGGYALHYEGYPAASLSDKRCPVLPTPPGSVEHLLCARRLQKGIKHAL